MIIIKEVKEEKYNLVCSDEGKLVHFKGDTNFTDVQEEIRVSKRMPEECAREFYEEVEKEA